MDRDILKAVYPIISGGKKVKGWAFCSTLSLLGLGGKSDSLVPYTKDQKSTGNLGAANLDNMIPIAWYNANQDMNIRQQQYVVYQTQKNEGGEEYGSPKD